MLKIKVIGSGCPTYQKLADMCKQVIEGNSLKADIEKVTDINKFAELGIFMTPGLIINDKLKSAGKLPTPSALEHWIMEAGNRTIKL